MGDDVALNQLRDLFVAALELDAPAREALLQEHARVTPGLVEETRALLARHESLGGYLDTLPVDVAALLEHDSPTPLLASGERLGEYEIVEFVGRGGSGEVYRARQLRLQGREVALKVLFGGTRNQRRRFLREARIASRFHHPNLIDVYDFGEDERRRHVYYSMRFIEGPSLAERLEEFARRGEPPRGEEQRRYVRYFAEIARALVVLQDNHLVHRDVKPANIVLLEQDECGQDSHAFLIDFGLVRAFEHDPEQSTLWATPSYAAPEQLMGRAVDGRSDVFSLGAIMHDVLAARRPEQRGLDAGEALEPFATVVPDIDPGLAAIVDTACAPEPGWRYRDARALSEDLDAWLEGRPIWAHRAGPLRSARRWLARNPATVLRWAARGLFATAAGLLLALGVIQGLAWNRAHRQAIAARECGDLAGLLAAIDRLPAPLRPAGSSDLFARGEPVALVAETLEREGARAAEFEAALHVARDGLEAQPMLARFLSHAIEPERLDGSTTLRLIARLFYECPDESPQQSLASEPFRSRFRSLLRIPTDLDRELCAASALWGSGTPRDLEALVDWIERNLNEQRRDVVEIARLGLRAMATIVRRSRVCGRVEELTALDLTHLLLRASRAVERVEERYGARRFEARDAWMALARAVVFATAGTGASPVTVLSHPWSDPMVLAAAGDAALRNALRRGRRIQPSWHTPVDREPLSDAADFGAFGWIVGSFGSRPLESELAAVARSRAIDRGLDVARCLELFGLGIEAARQDREGRIDAHRPDADTRLVSFSEQLASPWRTLQEPHQPRVGGEILAAWDFFLAGAPRFGTALDARLRCVSLESAEVCDGSCYARLGVFGLSELRLPFKVDSDVQSYVRLRVSLQKGQRVPLPYAGRAHLEILLDGSPVTNIATVTSTREQFEFPLCQQFGLQERVLSLRLDASSTATLRIYRVDLLGKSP